MPDPAELTPDAERALVQRASAGDEEAFGTLMRSHYEPVFRLVAAMLRDEHGARDVCQEIWLTVWKNLGTFRGDAKFSTWLHPIATRRAIAPAQIEQQAWEAAQRVNSAAVYNAYLAEYPRGRFVSLARVALAGVQPPSATPVSQGGAGTQVPDGSGDPMYQLTRELTEDRLVQRGFSVGKQLRPMCTVRTKSGATCQLEAYVGGENTKDDDAYTCQKMDRSIVLSGCRDGFVEGLAALTVDGSKKAGKENVVGVFLRGRPLYPLMHTYPGSADGTLLGITKSGSSFGCAYFPKWDSRDDTRRPECQFLSSAFGTYLMSRDGVDAVNAGKLDFSRVESNFQAWWRRSR